ncbi:MAG: hypothetical protein HWN66_13375 [Candidatus Helarchaeota archaeon]|nr:hypothetical protein [Candidatus Helarchaeota archaeon]
MQLTSILLDLPLDSEQYNLLFYGMLGVAIFTLILVIIYLMVGEEREETET